MRVKKRKNSSQPLRIKSLIKLMLKKKKYHKMKRKKRKKKGI
jgi:hypothetical protein